MPIVEQIITRSESFRNLLKLVDPNQSCSLQSTFRRLNTLMQIFDPIFKKIFIISVLYGWGHQGCLKIFHCFLSALERVRLTAFCVYWLFNTQVNSVNFGCC